MRFAVEDLSIGLQGRVIQRGVGFVLGPGSRLGIAGPSGCGKSTLLRSLATLDAAISGSLWLGGQTPAEHGYPVWRRRVLYVAQRATFFGGTVLQELARPFRFRSAEQPFDPAAAELALERLGLSGKRDAPTDELSEGERQRVALVRARLVGPAVYLLDEPTSALDRETAGRVETWLAEVDAALILVTHDDAQRKRVCSQIVELEAIGE